MNNHYAKHLYTPLTDYVRNTVRAYVCTCFREEACSDITLEEFALACGWTPEVFTAMTNKILPFWVYRGKSYISKWFVISLEEGLHSILKRCGISNEKHLLSSLGSDGFWKELVISEVAEGYFHNSVDYSVYVLLDERMKRCLRTMASTGIAIGDHKHGEGVAHNLGLDYSTLKGIAESIFPCRLYLGSYYTPLELVFELEGYSSTETGFELDPKMIPLEKGCVETSLVDFRVEVDLGREELAYTPYSFDLVTRVSRFIRDSIHNGACAGESLESIALKCGIDYKEFSHANTGIGLPVFRDGKYKYLAMSFIEKLEDGLGFDFPNKDKLLIKTFPASQESSVFVSGIIPLEEGEAKAISKDLASEEYLGLTSELITSLRNFVLVTVSGDDEDAIRKLSKACGIEFDDIWVVLNNSSKIPYRAYGGDRFIAVSFIQALVKGLGRSFEWDCPTIELPALEMPKTVESNIIKDFDLTEFYPVDVVPSKKAIEEASAITHKKAEGVPVELVMGENIKTITSDSKPWQEDEVVDDKVDLLDELIAMFEKDDVSITGTTSNVIGVSRSYNVSYSGDILSHKLKILKSILNDYLGDE